MPGKRRVTKRSLVIIVLATVIAVVAAVGIADAAMRSIQLSSPATFPVDI